MNAARQTYTVEDVKGMLLDRVEDVARYYAPWTEGAHIHQGGYWTLNPGRADRKVGSFVIWISGPRAGRWNDFSSTQHGDLLDLIALSLGCDLKSAFREARSFLGLQSDSPEDIARRKAAAERARQRQAEARRDEAAKRARRRKQAFALWLSARERIKNTPVEHYLRDKRGIDLERLGFQPRALRFHPACYYRHVDPETGEIIEGEFPAMLALASNLKGDGVACHRTYLGLDDRGRWGKAQLPEAKKILGDYKGASIHIWRGLGPRGGKGKRLSEADPGSHVFLTEGIEDALSCAVVLPEARILSTISLSNLAAVELPPAIASVTLVADRDEGPQARDALGRAVRAHADAGRQVRVWLNREGGKDLNDALIKRRAEQKEGAEHEELGEPPH
ncbi:hypothetical protein BMG03_00985 [Thioclava nitratireducens]|uniref:Toprim domain-containing protein n=1 Tax=Thioclava nitratireducens TaxID=1915078 RepID=A0ABN4X610_9RHOB|nr:toprim domain-containing protein [Thioclava nitratireducens]AQS46530.1 hypothetical protein BMG03_00985 [Thioclava nitratireducens]